MRLLSPTGRYERHAGAWCFIPHLPPLHRLASLDRIAADATARLDRLGFHASACPEDIERQLAEYDDFTVPTAVQPDSDGAVMRDVAVLRSKPLADRLAMRRRLAESSLDHQTLIACGNPDRLGEPVAARDVFVRVLRGGPLGVLSCPPPHLCAALIDEFSADARAVETGGFALAMLAYAHIIFVHPLLDGNGRLARSVAEALWAKGHEDRFPILLAPIFKRFHNFVAAALVDLMTRGGWSHFVWRMSALLSAYVDAVANVLPESSRVRSAC